MSESDFEEEDLGELAHDLYWNSDQSVNSIAEELGLSKGGLYQHILPLPTDGECPRCGGGVGYFNRTARERNEPTCLSFCENEESLPAGGAAALLSGRIRPIMEKPSGRPSSHRSSATTSSKEDDQGNDSEAFIEEFADVLEEDDFSDEVAFDLEGGFAGIAGLAGGGKLSDSDFEKDLLLEDPLPREKGTPRFGKFCSPLSESERTIVAGTLLAAAVGLLLLRLAKR